MIINSISLQNFQCYSGFLEKNIFEFKPGLNVVIGDNGSGKSKLYDAFYWLLYDKIFNSSSRSFEYTSHVGINLIADKAKAEAQIGDKIEVKVQLKIEETRYNNSDPTEYLLERSIRFEKLEETEDYNDSKCWKADNQTTTKVEKKDILNFKPMNEITAFERIIGKLLPHDMEPYLWFQGEQVDSLIDFKNEASLTKAIDVLSGIKVFDHYIEVAKKVSRQANEAYKREERQKSTNDSNSEFNLLEKDRLEKEIEKENENLEAIIDNINFAKTHQDELLGKIQDAQELEKLKNELGYGKREVTRIQNQLNEARKNFNSNLFSKKWLLRSAGKYVDQFEAMQKTYEERRDNLKLNYKIALQQEEARKHRLPENVPNKQYLEEMLSEKKCFLCNRGFQEGDSAYQYLSDILEKTKKKKIRYTEFLKQDLKKYFNALYSNAYSLKEYSIPNIDDSIRDEIENLDDYEIKLKEKTNAYREIEKKQEHIITTGSITQDEARNIVIKFKETDESKTKFTENKVSAEVRINQYEEELRVVNEELKKSIGSAIDSEIMERKEVLDNFLEATLSTRAMVYDQQIKRIEELANTHFQKMTRENKSVQGRIILEKRGKSYMPKNVDENGFELTSINDSNIILIKLATILAIVSAKGGTENHPLITDAPTSKFSDNYTIGFIKTVNEVFAQSIIISYDFYHNKELRERLLKDVDGLGKILVIEPSQPEAQRMNRTELSTSITELN